MQTGSEAYMKDLVYMVFVIAWIAGVVLAKGFWLTALACVFPFYSWYLVVEAIMINNGMI